MHYGQFHNFSTRILCVQLYCIFGQAPHVFTGMFSTYTHYYSPQLFPFSAANTATFFLATALISISPSQETYLRLEATPRRFTIQKKVF